MNETYVECLVKAKPSVAGKILKWALILLTVFFGTGGLLGASILRVILAVVLGVCAYMVNLYTDLEYEYLYVDRELVVDKVLARSGRKRVAIYKLDKIEIFAPFRSYRLDRYKNTNAKVKDYSIGEELKPDLRYTMIYEGGEKIILSPSEELIKVLKNVAPRKVFTD